MRKSDGDPSVNTQSKVPPPAKGTVRPIPKNLTGPLVRKKGVLRPTRLWSGRAPSMSLRKCQSNGRAFDPCGVKNPPQTTCAGHKPEILFFHCRSILLRRRCTIIYVPESRRGGGVVTGTVGCYAGMEVKGNHHCHIKRREDDNNPYWNLEDLVV